LTGILNPTAWFSVVLSAVLLLLIIIAGRSAMSESKVKILCDPPPLPRGRDWVALEAILALSYIAAKKISWRWLTTRCTGPGMRC
jgi:hypothetical protein